MTTEPATPGMDRIRLETAQDFIDALQQRPQFQETVLRHLLTADLLGLPEQVKQLARDVLEHRGELLELRNEFMEHRGEFLELRNQFVEHRKEFIEHREEFLELRNQFIEHRKEFVEHRGEFLEHREEFLELRNQFVEHREEFLELSNQFIEHRKEFLELRNQFVEHRKEFLEHREEFLELRNQFIEHRKEFLEYARKTDERLAALEAGQQELRQGQQELRTDLDNLSAKVVQIGGTVSRLDGANYENQAADYAPRRLRTVLGLSQPAAIATPRERTGLHAIADQAVVSGVISDDEADDLLLTDMAFAAVGPGGEQIQVIGEASITAQVRDCDRAVRRAEIMARATGTPTIPVVISTEAPDELVQAWQHEVTFFNIPNND